MFNKTIIVGNLTKDIELRYLQSGTAVGNTGIASAKKFKGSDGQQKEEVLFVDITFFGRSAEIANQYLKKGSKILVEGRLKLDSWEKDGQKHYKHTIVVENMTMLDGKPQSAPQQDQQQAQQQTPPSQSPTTPSVDDGEIPF